MRIENATADRLFLKVLDVKKIQADILRLDKIHPVVSGNKWFKLKYFMQDALKQQYKTVLTFGGAWSNHIIATACYAQQLNLRSIGVIRGERPEQLSETLEQAKIYGMELEFMSRHLYAEKQTNAIVENLTAKHGRLYQIPAGGAGDNGIRGSMEILSLTERSKYTHIICSIGTGTMFTGLINSSGSTQEVLGLPALKGLVDLHNVLQGHVDASKLPYCKILSGYHFGGYAKKTPELLQFMNTFYDETGVQTDFVYTGKLLYGCVDLVSNDYFPKGSSLLIIHSGGIQGNASLPSNALVF